MNTESENNDFEAVVFDDEANAKEAIKEKLTDLNVPGYQAEFDPIEADLLGAFVEDAMSEDDALESSSDSAEEE